MTECSIILPALNRLGLIADQYGVLRQDDDQIRMRFDSNGGLIWIEVNGHRTSWRLVLPLLRPQPPPAMLMPMAQREEDDLDRLHVSRKHLR